MRWRRENNRTSPHRIDLPIAVGLVCAIVAVTLWSTGYEAGNLLATQDDPHVIADQILGKSFDQAVANREIKSALDGNDIDLANSFSDLAADRHVGVDPVLTARLTEANSTAASISRGTTSLMRGLITGEPDDGVAFAGTALGDLFVFGDIRDAVREGSRLASGQQADELVLALAGVGLAVTAGTYATLGAGTPARLGLTLVKAARKTGRLGAQLASFLGRMLREVVDMGALRRAFATASITEPTLAIHAARDAIKVEKMGGLSRFATDVGRVQAKAGTQAAMDGLKLAESPRDVSRLATLAEKQGSKTRAILKLAGRAAIVFSFALFDLASSVFSVLMMLFGVVLAIKGIAERATRAWLRHRRRKDEQGRIRDLQQALATARMRPQT